MPSFDTPDSPRAVALRYGCAAGSVALAIGARLLLGPPAGGQFLYAMLLFAVLAAAAYGGFGPAVAAVVLGGLAAAYLDQYVGMALYLTASLGIALLGGQLRAARRRAGLIDQVHDAIVVCNRSWSITFWNRGAEQLYGFSRAEALGRVSHELLRSRTEGGFEAVIRAIDEHGSWEGELEHITRDGRVVIVENRMTAIRDVQGDYVIGTNHEITSRKQSEAALRGTNDRLEARVREAAAELARAKELLRQDEERFQLLVAGVKDYSILMLDPGGHVLSWNAGAERLKGYKAEEIVGQHFSRFYPREDIELGTPEEELKAAIAEGQVQYEGWRLRKDGSRFWATVQITAVRDQDGQLRGFSKIARDLTQSRNEHIALQESQARIGGIIDSAMDAIISVDEEQRIVLFNVAAEKMFRCPATTAMGQSLGMFIPGRFRDQHRRHIQGFAETGVTSRSMRTLGALSGLRADGEEFPIEAAISQLAVSGKKVYTVILRDITERERAAGEVRQLNAELEQRVIERTAELEAANKELEGFSYSVSHDLRAPLRAVDGFSQALLEDCGSLLPQEGQRYVQTIRQGAQQMGALIDDLLRFARLSRQPLNNGSVDTGALVREVLDDLRLQREGRQIEVRVGALPGCQGDRALLKQVWVNLLSNAFKYTRKREAAVVEVDCAPQEGEAVYFVRDNGTGFDMKYAHKLFGVFQRLHRVEDFEGTGVGLAIVQRVIHRHGGRVWGEGELGRGATFYFTLERKPNT